MPSKKLLRSRALFCQVAQETLLLGGQAVIEGVMIKGPNHYAVSVRKKGKILTMLTTLSPRQAAKIPFIRGVVNLYDMMVIGMKSMIWSSNQAADFGERASKKEVFFTVLFAAASAVGMFVFLPLVFTKAIISGPGAAFNIIDGGFRIIMFLLYLLIISLFKDVRRVFQYHGAEHMAVHCHEAGMVLTVANVRRFSPTHPRCGTSFLFIVLLLSILVFSAITGKSIIAQFLGRMLLIPVIAGISYEILRFGAQHEKNPLMRIFILPGLLLQAITTRVLGDDQIEVARASVAAVKKAENVHARKS